jgi:UDP-N-acetylmuramoyl-tripeptide--D-alanyl-D-alanine ligase
MSYKGEIARLVEIADPDVGVILNVLRVHLEHFSGIDAIAQAKGEMFAGLRHDAVAVWNADDPRVARLGRAFPGTSIPYGLRGRGREVTAEEIVPLGIEGSRFTLRRGQERVPVILKLAGSQHIGNALAAAAAGFACGVEAGDIASGLAGVRPAPMRGVLHRRADGVTVLDDTYNSNPAAMERAIELLAATKPRGRRILAAGDMLELGPYAGRAHARIGALAARSGIDLFVAVGPLSLKAAETARRAAGGNAGSAAAGPQHAVRHFEDSAAAAAWLAAEVRPGDLVLVKGSRGMKMERVVAALLGDGTAGGGPEIAGGGGH